jgi:hypothetical protein
MLNGRLGTTEDRRLFKDFMLSAPEVPRSTPYISKMLVMSDFPVPTQPLNSTQAKICWFMLSLITRTCDVCDSRFMSITEYIVEHGLTNAEFTHFRTSCGLRLSITAARHSQTCRELGLLSGYIDQIQADGESNLTTFTKKRAGMTPSLWATTSRLWEMLTTLTAARRMQTSAQ